MPSRRPGQDPKRELGIALLAALEACGTTRTAAASDLFPGRGRILDRVALGKSLLKPVYLAKILDALVVREGSGAGTRLRAHPLGTALSLASLRANLDSQDASARRPRVEHGTDIVGIGALNYDHIAVAGDFPLIVDSHQRWEEETSTQDLVDAGLASAEKLGATTVHSHGGSAFNVIQLLLDPRLECRVAFIGVSGQVPPAAQSVISRTHRDYLADLGCNVDLVRTAETTGGRCAAVMRTHDEGPGSGRAASRHMTTWQGANSELGRHLIEHFDEALELLERARMVYVTSVFYRTAAEVIALLVEQAVRRNPDLQVAFDPGEKWANERIASVLRILNKTSILFLKTTEVDAVVRSYGGTGGTDHWVDRIVTKMRRDGTLNSLVVIKDAGRVTFHEPHHRYGKDWAEPAFTEALRPDEVVDDTGAGDTFAAGYLAARLSRRLQSQFGGYLGLVLARSKLQAEGSLRPAEVPETADRLLGLFVRAEQVPRG